MIGCTCLHSASVFADSEILTDPKPEDFAYGVEVLVEDDHAFKTISLPDHFYEHIGRQDGKDLRIFNADGVPLTFTFRIKDEGREITRMQGLPLFPIYGESTNDLEDLSLKVERTRSGTIIDIKTDGERNQTENVIAYIIDNSDSNEKKSRDPIYQLEFNWTEPEYGFINGIRLEQSSDLRHWRNLVNDESLSKLSYQGEVLGKHTVDIGKIVDNFIRISWRENLPFKLTDVIARYRWTQSERELHWQTIKNLEYIDNVDKNSIEYGAVFFSTKRHAPVQRFTFDFGGTNKFYRGSIYSRADSKSDWTDHGRFLQYRLKMPGGVVQSPALHLPAVRDSEWLLKLETPKLARSSVLPVVKMGWYPERLTFLVQGRPPYTLAYGNPRVKPADTDLSILLNGLTDEQKKEIVNDNTGLSAQRPLGGVSKLEPEAPRFPWRTALLWLVLVAGVLIMAKMAVSLFKQMNEKK